jgi:hypothetical protein
LPDNTGSKTLQRRFRGLLVNWHDHITAAQPPRTRTHLLYMRWSYHAGVARRACKQGQLNKHKSVKQFNSPDTRLNMRSIGMGKVKLRLASIFNARNPSVDDMSVDKYIHNDCKN